MLNLLSSAVLNATAFVGGPEPRRAPTPSSARSAPAPRRAAGPTYAAQLEVTLPVRLSGERTYQRVGTAYRHRAKQGLNILLSAAPAAPCKLMLFAPKGEQLHPDMPERMRVKDPVPYRDALGVERTRWVDLGHAVKTTGGHAYVVYLDALPDRRSEEFKLVLLPTLNI
ncbi:hypothetical protein [Deinococcus soli (ex Cha et al. 2016)]|uniref:Uncharacterized protein n=2 Tax=Deinococcus soli (ex Cha et al. 2016) TaxID=1309411 RepID=A0AAE3XE18_9DEIO|nr:hypothetical protein [Deinococcus soli (ex Cha et al. 2016)]MDR6218777.1 hypothetical protein [Deinococcus soli (ex Cha et al. 2016)]MDR6328574.1 hypothetical protein [Deinococcus soli (ex Cha et al. 2016)]MDR6751939.1 hypothetical protein [Deinococcus soli (ex Cha et al. 2016)]